MNERERDRAGDAGVRTKALIGLSVAVIAAVGGWIGLSRATDRGIARLASIEAQRARCEQLWRDATTAPDTQRVDRIALSDTIDPQSNDALMRCGDLRVIGPTSSAPNAREMSGEPMPRGLR